MHATQPLKIAIVVHGRFHAFDLTRALLRRGHEPMLYTNYPAWAVERFGVPGRQVRSFWPHGVLARALGRLRLPKTAATSEQLLHRLFGRWASRALARERLDVVHPWSGVAEEWLQTRPGGSALTMLMRGSAHISTQARLLCEEAERTGTPQDQPSQWMIAREHREYALTDRIVVLSSFAQHSFVSQGVPAAKVRLVPLGASLEDFRPAPEVVEARRQRIASGAPLRVLYVGAVSFQKGLWDLAEVVRRLDSDHFQFRFVGPCLPEATSLVASLGNRATFTPKQPQAELPAAYAWGDVFVFPTIQDGFGMVLAQASAAALPLLATSNCSAPDLILPGRTGWVIPIRSPDLMEERLRWCHQHRSQLVDMVTLAYQQFRPRTWDDVAADFEALCLAELGLAPALSGEST